ncbi:hypothetical protein G7Y89_g97 [Cudoniella acicularis]|uniref:Heterokaryon incompatibility domain-containing protein n=1 Tax=Cudoniella acicularis TaxID=354080 RepID=A0A8H4RXV7_9HELO|nr:hypothetical protein G7Y89_g97 [Cudoniella acicularis]
MVKRRLSISSEDTDDESHETIVLLRTQGVSNERIKKFKARTKRIAARCAGSGSRLGEFCSNCGNANLETIRKAGGFCISNSFARLKESSKHCQLCRLVLMSLRNKLPEIDSKLENQGPTTCAVAVKFNRDGSTDTAQSGFRIDRIPQVSVWETFRLSMNSKADEEISERFSLPLDPRPKADQKFELMKRWLEAEINSPKRSLAQASPNLGTDQGDLFPSRLIYVPPNFAVGPCRLRLVNIEDVAELGSTTQCPRYVTLSHRWGPTHHFTTTRTNLQSRQVGFDFQDLPRTYRDAVVVAARLGFSYLWIDAICIVQDNSEEWLSESEKMGNIYRHAVCTIASHCSKDDDGGFLEAALQKRGSIKFSSCDLKGTFLRSTADLELDISRSPLSKRGWILQERFLSTRILHFATGMIYLETVQGIKSEDGVTPMAPVMNIDASNLLTAEFFLYRKPVTLQNFSKYLLPIAPAEIDDQTSKSEVMIKDRTAPHSPLEWFSLLEMYTTCSLTKEGDKLTAISGIAKIYRHNTSSPYLAGIWADRLAIGLMWMNVGSPLKRPSFPRASSWSWAAYDGPIQFPLAYQTSYYLLATTCKLIHPATSTTWLQGPGALTIQVPLLSLSTQILSGDLFVSLYREELLRPQNFRAWDKDDHGLWRYDQDPPLHLFNVHNAHRFLWTTQVPHVNDERSWIVFDSENGLLKKEDYTLPLSCASFATFISYDNDRKHVLSHMVVFLLPVEFESESINTYRRIGAGIIRETLLTNLQFSCSQDLKQSHGFTNQEIILV